VLYRKGLYQSAVQYLEKAVNNDQKSSERNAVIRRYHLAMTYFKLGDQKKGHEVLLEALQQDPKLPEAVMAQTVLHQSMR
jgi:Tfp pilus assembly protein PilF